MRERLYFVCILASKRNIHAAISREKQIKGWNRAWKIKLIEKENSGWNDLWEKITAEVI